MSNKVGILDLGTNTFHLLIAYIGEDSFDIIHKEKFPVRIGQEGISKGIISDEAEKRALSAIKSIKSTIRTYEVDEIKAYATSAIRNASNGKQLLDKIKAESGIKADMIDGETEAEYIYLGVRQALDLGNYPVLIMDIGGGSVEFILANQHAIFWKKSFEIGAQRLFDRYHKHDPVHPDDLVKLYQFLHRSLTPLFETLNQFHPKTLIGCSGTFDTLSDIYCIRNNITKDPTDTERPIDRSYFLEIHKDLISKNIRERLAIPGMSSMRADMISMSSSLIHFLLSNYPFEKLRASAYSLKEGIISQYADKLQVRELSA